MKRILANLRRSQAEFPPKAQKPFLIEKKLSASSLITTLLTLVVLSTIVVAFLQSMSVERNVARSVKNRYQAQLAAEAGAADALVRLGNLMVQNPYHAIGYTNVGGQTLTVLAGSSSYTNTTAPGIYYLLSVTNPAISPAGLNATNSTALNLPTPGRSGWIGSPVSNGAITNRECRAPWVYLLKTPALPHQPDPTAANFNPYVARYAYWIEDETSKLDFRVAGNNNAAGGFQRSTNSYLPGDVDLGAAPLINGAPIPTNGSDTNNALITFRNSTTNLPVDGRVLGQASDVFTNAAETSRFYLTMAAYANDLAGTGQKRVNLNALVTDGFATNTITSDLDDIAYAITGSHLYPGLNNAADNGFFHDLPDTSGPMANFGSRFYAGATGADKAIYLRRIAANIRDYIDADSQPTFVNSSGQVESGTRPVDSWPTGSWPQAIGKEAIPYFQEHAWAGTEVSWSISGSGANKIATATIEIDHYLEFFNPSTKDFVAPPGTFIKLTNLPTWSAGKFPDLTPDDFELDISGITFHAGNVVVITTNPGPNDPTKLIPTSIVSDPCRFQRIAPNPITGRRFTGRMTDEPVSGAPGFQRDPLGREGSATSDYSTRFVMGSTNGIIQALPAVGFSASGGGIWNFRGLVVGDRNHFVYSTSLRGNDAPSRSGDPRSLSEQLAFKHFDSGNGENTRFYGNIQGPAGTNSPAPIPGIPPETLGFAAISFVDPAKMTGSGAWPDYAPVFNDTASTAYAVIADQPMTSIGELGHIYDPGNRLSDGALPIDGARGGGRTFKIGQPDDVIAGAARFSTAWQNAAWRLTDIFGVSTNRSQPELDPASRGKVNINSVIRDGGTVLQALLRKFVFLPSPDSDPNIAGQQLSSAEINRLVLSISNYITANGPLLERGELSQITYFSGAATNLMTVAGNPVRTTADRGREEIFRRMVELITTRSASFSVFAVGEAVQESPSGSIKALSKASKGAVYRFDPGIAKALRSKATNFQATKLYDIE